MRQDLMFTALDVLAYNIIEDQTDLKFYEFGKVYKKINSNYKEQMRLGIYLTGKNEAENWIRKK